MENDIQNEIKEAEVKSEEKSNITKKSILLIFIGTIIISAASGAIFGFMAGGAGNLLSGKFGNKFSKLFPDQSVQPEQVTQQKIIEEDSAITDVVQKTTPAVVSIVITKDVPKFNGFFDPFNFFGDQGQGTGETQKQTIGGGSGFLVSTDGMIVTNKHVIEDMQADYTVVTSDGKEHVAKVLARHPIQDIAVIKIDGSGYQTLNLGDSDGLKVGQTVIAIGNSLGEFANSVSKGIVSGLKRNIVAGSSRSGAEQLNNIIQTDAAINPGNSGGPLLDITGNVIGVNVAMAQGAQNIGFALPINQVKKIIETVKGGGQVSVPFLGVRYVIVNDQIQKENSLPLNYGALVLRGNSRTELAVMPGSPADKAGIVENDIILEINGEKVTNDNQLTAIVSKYNVGDVINLKVWHKGDTKDVQVTLAKRQ
jgi:serine protease Do